jgi:hypothetical protein
MSQQSIQGECNVQLGEQSNNNTVILLCQPRRGAGISRRRPLILEATVEGLQAGSASFEVVLQNNSADYRAIVAPAWLSLSDDKGNVYHLDCLSMVCARQIIVPPNRMVRFDVSLEQTINQVADSVYFTLSDVWYGMQGHSYARSFGAVEWSLPIERGRPDNSDRANAERALGLTQEDRLEIELALEELDFNPGTVDGVFDSMTRRAIAEWQAVRGSATTGYLERMDAAELRRIGFGIQSEREFENFMEEVERRGREFDRDFGRGRHFWPPPPFE